MCELTGWGESTAKKIFAHDDEFPAIKKGKQHFVEFESFKKYLSKRRE